MNTNNECSDTHITVSGCCASHVQRAAQHLTDKGFKVRFDLHAHSSCEHSENVCTVDGLTERETEVLQTMVDGFDSREAAAELYISYETLRTHKRNIFKKLGVGSTAGAISQAVQYGLLPHNEN